MPSPVIQPVVNEELVRQIKRALLNGSNPAAQALMYDLPYMIVYRIAVGATWKHVNVRGVESKGKRSIPRRTPRLTPTLRDSIYGNKRVWSVSNADVAKRMALAESMVARAVRDGRALMAARVQRLLMTSGSNDLAVERYGLSTGELDALLALASTQVLPNHLKAEAARD